VRTHDTIGLGDFRRLPAAARVTIPLCVVLALAGCSVGPKFVKPEVSLNDEWSQQEDSLLAGRATADSVWWTAFGDSTLNRLVELAYHQNLPLQIAGLRIMEARAQLNVATGRQYPQVQVVAGNATAIGLSENAANIGGFDLDRDYWDFAVGFDAAWEMDFWGKYRGEVRAEEANYLATVADYDNGLVSLTAEVARTYALIRTFEVLIAYARENVILQEDGLRIAESRFRNGATSELDVTQATTLLESTRATIPRFESSLQQAQNAMSTLLGQPTGTVQALLAGPTGIPVAPADVAVSVPADLLRRRPDIRKAELYAVAQCARIGVAKADYYPRFSLFGSIGAQTTNNGGSLLDVGSIFYSIGPRLIWPIFNYGRIKNNVRVQDARLQQLLVDYENTVLNAAREVEDGMTGYLKSQESATYAKNAADSAQRSVDLAFVQYREGAVDFQRVLDAQRSLLQEENTLARTRSDIATNLISLYKALGGGWQLRQGQPVVSDSTRVEMEDRTNWGDLFSPPPVPQTSTGASATPR
jgi:NodT family efflux transporter outer membrane factor (OMF) lipoprotein